MINDRELRKAYSEDLKSLTNKNGVFYRKNDPRRKVTLRASDGLDRMIQEYAKDSPIVRSFCGAKEFDEVLARARKNYKR